MLDPFFFAPSPQAPPWKALVANYAAAPTPSMLPTSPGDDPRGYAGYAMGHPGHPGTRGVAGSFLLGKSWLGKWEEPIRNHPQ